MRYVAIFHANLNYAYLTPDRYEFVIRKSYELIFDVMEQQFPQVKFVFEASGYTLDEIGAPWMILPPLPRRGLASLTKRIRASYIDPTCARKGPVR